MGLKDCDFSFKKILNMLHYHENMASGKELFMPAYSIHVIKL